MGQAVHLQCRPVRLEGPGQGRSFFLRFVSRGAGVVDCVEGAVAVVVEDHEGHKKLVDIGCIRRVFVVVRRRRPRPVRLDIGVIKIHFRRSGIFFFFVGVPRSVLVVVGVAGFISDPCLSWLETPEDGTGYLRIMVGRGARVSMARPGGPQAVSCTHTPFRLKVGCTGSGVRRSAVVGDSSAHVVTVAKIAWMLGMARVTQQMIVDGGVRIRISTPAGLTLLGCG